MPKRTSSTNEPKVTLKTLAEHLHLTAGTISALNDSAAARAIPEHTKRRILEAARELNYKPNYFARSLRLQRTYTIGVIAQQIGDPYGAAIISGIEEYLRNSEYFFLTVIHRHDQRILQTYSQMLLARGVEGFITVDTSIKERPAVPTVAVAGHTRVPGVTSRYTVTDGRSALSYDLTWAFGTARIGQSYLFKDGQKFFEARVTYFDKLKGLGFTPDRDLASPKDVAEAMYRPVSSAEIQRCFGCHTTASHIEGTFDEPHLIPGVTCEACHGPGAKHVAAMNSRWMQMAAISPSSTRRILIRSMQWSFAAHAMARGGM